MGAQAEKGKRPGGGTILDRLTDHARERVEEAKRRQPLAEIRQRASDMPKGNFAFENALKKSDIAFICECKKASPSKGLIAPEFLYLSIAREYEAAGADAVSVLTEPKWFLGSDKYLKDIAGAVSIPCLRKDFTVDEYMIYEAKLLGASAVLLICSILSEEQIKEYIGICDGLGLSALVEAHDGEEVEMALSAGARMIGVNNRNLKDFSVDTENSRRLRQMIPPEVLFVSESGVGSAEDVSRLRGIGADAVLIGETLMRAADKKAKLRELKGEG
ncbi:MAG TPA: indole-3-glycerol phosphate synthase TrpC [Candidatus Mediterraneibacter tabaqchaliae]|uniref:Indole-3-glycerol phosphate synthase n=1 Tax=Candidatus Mediterraneibacter tabaqchaliae TaxID=2838689 RepID=A0A9D2U0R5_9FIRM|nr:indole-3-glycerol phosphate synthase TrpC [Candidatus Mediterraneibacter tabaqchaliae]